MIFAGGMEASRGIVICWKFYRLWYLFIEYYIVSGLLPGSAHPLARSSCYLGVFPRHNGIRWRQHRFPTRVHSARGTWLPTATSHHCRCLRLTLPKSHNGQCLSMWHPTLKQGWLVLTRIITGCHYRSNDT
jgi:hypothetical protein